MSNLIELYASLNGNTDVNEITNNIITKYSDPMAINEITAILASREIPEYIRKSAAVGLKLLIKMQKDIYINDPNSAFSNLLQVLMTETDEYIGQNISNALVPIFDGYGEEWGGVTQVINQLVTSENLQSAVVGTHLLINFLPTTRIEYVAQMQQIIIPLIPKLLSVNTNTALLGFQLFSAVQLRDFPANELNLPYTQIFDQMLNIFHQSLISEDPNSGPFADCIAKSLKKSIPFDSPVNSFQKILSIASDTNIPIEERHLPMFPIKSLVKTYGKELKQLLPSAISLFLNISASQFVGTGYEDEDNSRTVINLFQKFAEVFDGDMFYNMIMGMVSRDGNPAASFASMCAIYGSDELTEQYENNIQDIMNYIFAVITIPNPSVIEICMKTLCELAYLLPDAISPYANNILKIAFQLLGSAPQSSVLIESIHLIATIFQEVDLNPTLVVGQLSALKGAFIQAPYDQLKGEIMSAIASGIYACRDDISNYAHEFVDIVGSGLDSKEPSLYISSVEALGNLMCFAKQQILDLFNQGIQLLLEKSNDPDMNLRHVCILSLVNLVNEQSSVPEDVKGFIPLVLTIAISAIGINTLSEEDIYSDSQNTSPLDIILVGFKLLKAVLKNYPSECELFARAFPKIFSDFVPYVDSNIAKQATSASVYYIMNIQPDDNSILDFYYRAIAEQKKLKRCKNCFKAYSKLLAAQCPLAIARLGQFLECAIAAVSRNLPCQKSKCVDEDERFSFDPEFMEIIYTIICDSFKVSIEIIPAAQFIQIFSSLLSKVGKAESLEILGTLGDYVSAGGSVSPEIIQYALGKLQEIDYKNGPDAVYFIRVIIKMQPNLVSPLIPNLLPFFLGQLTSEVSSNQYYWATMTNVIAALFDLAKSPTLGSSVNMTQVIPLILSKWPIQGDYDEAEFVYSSLLQYFQANTNEIGTNLELLFTVLIRTLSLKNKTFAKFNLTDDTTSNLVNFTKTLMNGKPDILNAIPQILENDQIKVEKIKQRLGLQ
ncbi:hypothetical protein TRFO_11353 [Tritrichomonas foetus]|uniref:Importin N-terminal domain-containing protein n=1 Tax=Tritrichomonas foetus TaxID=1144522 RepID=A0A1J4J9I7_9EUKA|nr:hypothetical protein TRFO_11353 [Tritrichomonas foetus]|eukprot:OHS94093.1 hypothetical protein TRFO_11353 [Tritrichomonas foetus]